MSAEQPGERHGDNLADLTVDDLFVRDDAGLLAETFRSERLTSMEQEFAVQAESMEDEISDAQAVLDALRHKREQLRRRASIHAQAAEMARAFESME